MTRSRMARAGVLLVVLCLSLVLGGAASGSSARANATAVQSLAKQLRGDARGSVTISKKDATKVAGFIRAGRNGDLLPSDRSGSPSAKATGFIKEYGALLGVTGDSKLVQASKGVDELGAMHIRYRQTYKGIPVWGATVVAHLDKANNLTAVNGVAVPGINVRTTPRLSRSAAGTMAAFEVANDPPRDEAGKKARVSVVSLKSTAQLVVYRMGLVRGVEGTSQLAYKVEVTNRANVRDMVFLEANTGKVLNRYSMATDALHRVLFEASGTPPNINLTKVWEEGDTFPGSLNGEQQNLVTFSGQSYGIFSSTFGRDSYDGLGAEMHTVNNDPRIQCPNANWNGITTNYCNGVTADDVVAHEWGHAYTEFTHGLIYQWQPGALNESYSDIWGEVVDQINGVGSDSPAPTRTVGACSTHTVPVPILIINAPTPGECAAGAAAFGPPLTPAGTTGDLAYVGRGCDPAYQAGQPLDPYLANPAGKVALIDRGSCTFAAKVKKAQDNGAIAVVAANLPGGGAFGLGGGDPTIVIPSLGISNENGNLLKGYLQTATANVTLKVKGGALPREETFRWLLAEDATAFNPTAGVGNHAIRDMWDPTCLSDPGRVADAEYQCDTSDAGGVHTNSGVPNHGFALLVDGGTYNGQTVTGIGLQKAAHLYWRAQSVYQTETTDFDDHADALEQSCQDLIGQPLSELKLTGSPTQTVTTITAADCNEVSDMIAAIELRHDPTQQCNFKPLLDPNTPQLCGPDQKNPSVFYSENFSGGLGGWTLENAGRFAGWQGTNWVAKSSLPGGRSGTAAFAEDLDGQCDQNGGDRSGRMHLISPAVSLPNAAIQSPRVTFMQYVATELDVDGGNVKLSINGGDFTLIPASAFTFNAYPSTLIAAPRNTSPMAGEPAFSGTDGGIVFGSWAESQIDLTKVGVKPGDTIRLRFDFGMDGCGAIDGWYVDDVKVLGCNTKKAPEPPSVAALPIADRRG